MPIRTATVTKKLAANGQALHRAITRRMASAANDAPSEEEAALAEERRQLKEEREIRKAKALLPRPSALDRLVRTHHPEAKGPKAKKAHDEVKKPKARRTRAEKHAEKEAAIEAARKPGATKKPAKPAK